MNLFEWDEQLRTGIDSIDNQHKMLIDIINNLDKTLQNKAHPDEIIQAFDAARVYALKHFKYEQELFEQYDYPQSVEHLKEHQQLIEKLESLYQNMMAGDIMIGVELLEFLKQWITHHILKTDMAYCDFFIEKGVK